jgi:serine O-acetyltransferase
MFSLIKSDIRAKAEWLYGDSSGEHMLKTLFSDGTLAMICYRAMQWSGAHGITPLAMLCNKINALLGQCIIGRNARFGQRFVLIHSQGVVINSSVVGGDDIRIEHQVTIGAEKEKAPHLGNRVFIGAGAKIIGAIAIGNDVKVGANAVVTKDLPDGATAVGIPAAVVRIYGERQPVTPSNRASEV